MPIWLPNAITMARVALIPVIVGLLYKYQFAAHDLIGSRLKVLSIFLLLGVTDILDGWLARRFDAETQLGALLDAIADKLAQFGLLVWLTFNPGPVFTQIPLWLFIVIVLRDLVLGLGWVLIKQRRGAVQIEHKLHGKTSSLLLFALIGVAICGIPAAIAIPLAALIAAVVVLSTLDYVATGVRQYRGG